MNACIAIFASVMLRKLRDTVKSVKGKFILYEERYRFFMIKMCTGVWSSLYVD